MEVVRMTKAPGQQTICLLAISLLLVGSFGCAGVRSREAPPGEDPYARYVWPPPPDEPKIKLEEIIEGRADVEATSSIRKKLLGASPLSPYDTLRKPFAVTFDGSGRILVTDSGRGALIRFDRQGRRMDVLGTKGAVHLKVPLGVDVGTDGTIYVADVGLKKVVAFDPEGEMVAVYGREGELVNPTGAVPAPDNSRLYVADSKAHTIVVFDLASGAIIETFGRRGEGDGEFNFPTSLSFGPAGNLYVVDQLNSRVQVFTEDGEYLDQFGKLGVGFANFVRPKDVAVDEQGFIYVTDNAFNNVQLFDTDFSLLTFVGEGGRNPGQFHGASGVAVRDGELVVVDQLGRRVQVFRLLGAKTG
jgi:DNA-binding beta-propeller fold protein YncE